MAADSETAEASLLEQLISSRNRDLSLFLPLILGFSNSRRREPSDDDDDDDDDDQDAGQQTGRQTQDRIILINPFTQGMIVIESSRSLDALIREISDKDGLPPASKTSIDAMPKVEITEDCVDLECAICLEGWEIGGEAREMPCKHKYHSNCIEKWLGIHGSCPVCRFKMPVDEDHCKKRSGGGGNEEERGDRSFEREVWVSFSFNRRNSSSTTTTTSSSSIDSDSSSSSSPSTQSSDEVSGDVNGSSSNNEEN